ncbi:hypothetical protein [Chryseolinea sp. H1M3-3]|uniref:hypothetical protein n=1 Tax=Chryseolinea sp. H1M3-3 TaxID=3034144 RepID=UPI0023EAF732|nr:hypothetical protein [Chryseolinea sp. H1M3-3]
MVYWKRFWTALAIFFYVVIQASFAQEKEGKDSVGVQGDTIEIIKIDTTNRIIDAVKDTKLTQEILKGVTRKQEPEGQDILTIRSEEAFLPFEGKIIRQVLINHIDFERSITDTTQNMRNRLVKIGNTLHNTSKEWVIRDHVFFKEKKPLNAYLLADNERYIRDLDFIVDARIIVVPLLSTQDSVDVLVVTRDVFSIGGSFNPRGVNETKFKIYDANFMGWGQRLQFNGHYDQDRNPNFGYELYYRKSSLAGSLINVTAGYTQLNTGSSYGNEEESAYYLNLERPLVSPYSRLAGGLEFSRNWSKNFYQLEESVFRNYRYEINDLWLGYNIGARQNRGDRSRHFVSARIFQQHFSKKPVQTQDSLNPAFNSRTYWLGAFTFFKQEFYKTQFVYGFGRTEDVPYGHTMSILAGWQNLLDLKRAYIGVDAEKSFVHAGGNFYTLSFRVGGFPYQGRWEDATLLLSGKLFSKIKHYKKFLIRQSADLDFTYVFNQRTNTLLDINSSFGLEGFVADSVLGTKRLHARYELVLYSPWKILGFRLAPLVFADVAIIAPRNRNIFYDKPFFGIGSGVRTRNENLVFGTVEFKFFYYPHVVEDISRFKVGVTTNLRIKYSGRFVKAPSFILYN